MDATTRHEHAATRAPNATAPDFGTRSGFYSPEHSVAGSPMASTTGIQHGTRLPEPLALQESDPEPFDPVEVAASARHIQQMLKQHVG